jgi:membrane protein YdbS with pleckstrin-like domain
MVFPSKIDAWVPAVAIGIPVASLAVVLFATFKGNGPLAAAIFAVATVLVVVSFVAWLFLTTQYRVENDVLTVRSGPLRWKIPIRDIDSVTATRNPLSSPALSLDRLQIHYRSGARETDILVSPDDKRGFIAALVASNGAIRVR